MILTKIVIQGYKSFNAPQTINFAPTINVFTAPNGSGKSNVLSALRFALGASINTLGVTNLQSLLFESGSLRAPSAKVVVTFSRPHGTGSTTTSTSDPALAPYLASTLIVEGVIERTVGGCTRRHRMNGRVRAATELPGLLREAGVLLAGNDSLLDISQGHIHGIVARPPPALAAAVAVAAGIENLTKAAKSAQHMLTSWQHDFHEISSNVGQYAAAVASAERRAALVRAVDAAAETLNTAKAHARVAHQAAHVREAEKVMALNEQAANQGATLAEEADAAADVAFASAQTARDLLTGLCRLAQSAGVITQPVMEMLEQEDWLIQAVNVVPPFFREIETLHAQCERVTAANNAAVATKLAAEESLMRAQMEVASLEAAAGAATARANELEHTVARPSVQMIEQARKVISHVPETDIETASQRVKDAFTALQAAQAEASKCEALTTEATRAAAVLRRALPPSIAASNVVCLPTLFVNPVPVPVLVASGGVTWLGRLANASAEVAAARVVGTLYAAQRVRVSNGIIGTAAEIDRVLARVPGHGLRPLWTEQLHRHPIFADVPVVDPVRTVLLRAHGTAVFCPTEPDESLSQALLAAGATLISPTGAVRRLGSLTGGDRRSGIAAAERVLGLGIQFRDALAAEVEAARHAEELKRLTELVQAAKTKLEVARTVQESCITHSKELARAEAILFTASSANITHADLVKARREAAANAARLQASLSAAIVHAEECAAVLDGVVIHDEMPLEAAADVLSALHPAADALAAALDAAAARNHAAAAAAACQQPVDVPDLSDIPHAGALARAAGCPHVQSLFADDGYSDLGGAELTPDQADTAVQDAQARHASAVAAVQALVATMPLAAASTDVEVLQRREDALRRSAEVLETEAADRLAGAQAAMTDAVALLNDYLASIAAPAAEVWPFEPSLHVVSDGVAIRFTRAGADISISEMSGGQRAMAGLVMALALASMAAHDQQCSIVLDECDAALDGAARAAAARVLESVRDTQLIIVSHHAAWQDFAANAICLAKDGSGQTTVISGARRRRVLLAE